MGYDTFENKNKSQQGVGIVFKILLLPINS